MVNRQLLTGLLLLLLGGSSHAFSAAAASQGAHVHGEAMLNIVLDGNALYIEFDLHRIRFSRGQSHWI